MKLLACLLVRQVANVQFNAAKTMGKLIPHVDGAWPIVISACRCERRALLARNLACVRGVRAAYTENLQESDFRLWCCGITTVVTYVHMADATLGSVIKPSLEELLSHGDVDVEFFAAQALALAA